MKTKFWEIFMISIMVMLCIMATGADASLAVAKAQGYVATPDTTFHALFTIVK